jgi:hypothetical protein
LKHTPAPLRNSGQRLELAEVTSQRGLPCHCADTAGNIYSVLVYICRVVLHLMRKRRGAAGSRMSITIKYLRRATSDAAGSGLGNAVIYLRRKTSGAASNGLGTTIKYLRGATSGATSCATSGLIHNHKIWLQCPYTKFSSWPFGELTFFF